MLYIWFINHFLGGCTSKFSVTQPRLFYQRFAGGKRGPVGTGLLETLGIPNQGAGHCSTKTWPVIGTCYLEF